MEIREIVKQHAGSMEYKLSLNDEAKGDSWKKMPIGWLLDKLNEELTEFRAEAVKEHPNITQLELEGADVSNVIMFICENARMKWAIRAAEKVFGK